MEFKSIEQLTITDCCNQLTVSKESLKKVVVAVNMDTSLLSERIFGNELLAGAKNEIAQRLTLLLIEDRKYFLRCKTLQQFENYLSTWSDGLWRNEAFQKVKTIKNEQEEKEFYLKSKSSINGLERYLHKYPRGKFSESARKELAEKRRNKHVKRIITIVATVITVLVICSMNYHSSSYIQSDSNVTFNKKGGITTCEISTDATDENIQAYVVGEWIQASIENGVLNIKAEPNHGDTRNATIHLYAYTTLFGVNLWKEEFNVYVKEESGLSTFLTISNSTFTFDKFGTSEAVCSIGTDGMNLNISSNDDWIIMNENVVEQGNNFYTKLSISPTANESGERTGTISVKSDNFEKEIVIKQNSGLATYFNISPDNLVMSEEGTEEGYCYSVKVDTDGTNWSISDAPLWLTAEAKVQQGRLQVTLPQNIGRIKTGTITIISNNGDSRKISVKQWGDPTDFSASPSRVRFDTSGDYKYVDISNNSHKPISVSDDETWISSSVIGNSRIKIYCSQNNSSPRSGSIDVNCGNEKLTINVKQAGWVECSRCNGNGQIGCTNYSARWNYNTFAPHPLHQIYKMTGQYYSFGAWFPQYSWVNCPTCDGDGKIECPQCKGKGKVQKSS